MKLQKCFYDIMSNSTMVLKIVNRGLKFNKWSNPMESISIFSCSSSSCKRFLSNFIDVAEEVKFNLVNKLKPVVALESTIITHGMPYPHNLNVATQVEDIVRSQDCVPATIGVIDGRIKVGLNSDELTKLASPPDPSNGCHSSIQKAVKTSRRDFPFVIGKRLCGGTTVSGTIVVCNMVGIDIFVTGGIGGIHRDGHNTMDVSADLIELSRNQITVVSSGVKSILDVQRTLEYLETFGVCVVTFGESRNFPAFYTRESGFNSPYNVATIEEAASLISALNKLNLNSGLLLAVPVPSEYCKLDHESVEKVIRSSLSEAKEKNIQGKEVTPFLLDKINAITKGQLLQTNIGLIKNNALIGSQVAVKLHNMKMENDIRYQPVGFNFPGGVDNKLTSNMEGQGLFPNNKDSKRGYKMSAESQSSPVVVIGGSNLDCIVTLQEHLKFDGRMVSGKLRQIAGGVGRNIAEASAKLGLQTRLLSAVGDDLPGRFILKHTKQFVNCEDVLVLDGSLHSTSSCIVVLDPMSSENSLLIGDMSTHNHISKKYLLDKIDIINDCSVVLFDGNLPIDAVQLLLNHCGQKHIPVWFEPTDIVTADKPFSSDLWKMLSFLSPNMKELRRIHAAVTAGGDLYRNITFDENINSDPTDIDELLKEAIYLATPIAKYINTVMVTLGHHGVLIVGKTNKNLDTNMSVVTSKGYDNIDNEDSIKMSARYYPTMITDVTKITSVSGAGDCCVAGYMKGVLNGLTEPGCIFLGLSAAVDSLYSINTVPNQFRNLYDGNQLNKNLIKPKLIIDI